MNRCLIFILSMICVVCLSGQSNYNLRQIERDFRKNYRFQENAEIEFNYSKRMFGRDTVVRHYRIKMFDRSFLNILDNIYIKMNDTEIISDQDVDSTYILYENGRLNAEGENLDWIQLLNEYNPLLIPLDFFGYLSKAQVDTTFFKEGKKIIVITYSTKNDLAKNNYRLWLNLTDTIILKLSKRVFSEYHHLRKFIEVTYINYKKDHLKQDFNKVKSSMLSRGDRSMVYQGKPYLEPGDTLEGFEYLKLNGDTAMLEDFDKEYYLIDFWYMACPPCMRAIPAMKKVYGKNDNVSVIGVNTYDSDLKDLMIYKKEKGIPYTILYTDQLTQEYHFTYPTFIIMDKNLVVLKVLEGYTENSFEQFIEYFKNK